MLVGLAGDSRGGWEIYFERVVDLAWFAVDFLDGDGFDHCCD